MPLRLWVPRRLVDREVRRVREFEEIDGPAAPDLIPDVDVSSARIADLGNLHGPTL
jgi:hypothetical protein